MALRFWLQATRFEKVVNLAVSSIVLIFADRLSDVNSITMLGQYKGKVSESLNCVIITLRYFQTDVHVKLSASKGDIKLR